MGMLSAAPSGSVRGPVPAVWAGRPACLQGTCSFTVGLGEGQCSRHWPLCLAQGEARVVGRQPVEQDMMWVGQGLGQGAV